MRTGKKLFFSLLVFIVMGATSYGQKLRDSLLFSDPVALSLSINSQFEESMPVFSKDSSKLYFVRTYHPENVGGGTGDQDIWVSQWEDGQWSTATNIEDLNNKENNGAFGINDNDNTIYLLNAYLKKKRTFEKGVAVANKKDGEWHHKPETLNIPNLKIKGDFYGFFVNGAENVLIISNNGVGSLGQEDLYVSLKDSAGEWGSPVHLGPTVNSKGFEMSPFLSPGTDTLYFSSDGHGGHGEADIFYCVRKDDSWQNWSDPINLGPQINSEKFDAYFIRSDNKVYWSSNRNGELSDIYTARVIGVQWPPLMPDFPEDMIDTLFVTVDPGEVLVVKPVLTFDDTITFNDLGDTLVVNVPRDTIFVFELPEQGPPPGPQTPDTVFVHVTPDDSIPMIPPAPDTVFVDVPGPPADTVFVYVDPEDSTGSTPPVMTPGGLELSLLDAIIYFDLDKYYLTFDSRMILNRVASILSDHKEWSVRLEGHCDIRDSDPYNMWLSDQRIKSTEKYLMDKGIDKARLNSGFYGETELAVETPTVQAPEDDHHQNRRVTIQFGLASEVKQLEENHPMPDIPMSPIHGISIEAAKGQRNSQTNKPKPIVHTIEQDETDYAEQGLVYKVQIQSLSKKVDSDSKKFNGLDDVSHYEHGGYFKYTSGSFSTEAEAEAHRKRCKAAGYSGSFVVPFIDGERVLSTEGSNLPVATHP